MKSLEEVFEAIEAFKEDMEALGVRVHASVAPTPTGSDTEVTIHLRTLVRENLEEDLESELGNPHRRLDLWVKPLGEDLEEGDHGL